MTEAKNKISNDLLARLDWAEKTLHAMLYGAKPFVDIRDPGQSWLYEQMTRMYKAGFLCEEPQSYMTLPGEDPAEVGRFKGVTTREPLPKQLTSEYEDFKEVAHDERRNVRNFKILGADDAYRYRRDALEQADDADSFILTRGGIMELYQFLLFVRAQREQVLDFYKKILVVQNAHGFWNPALKALGGVQRLGNNFVTDTRHDTAEVVEKLLGGRKGLRPRRGDDREVLPPGSTVFFITGNRKKVNDYKKVFNRRGTDAQCVWFHQKFDKPEGADEFSYSYVGNLVEKLDKLYMHIRDHYGTEGFRAALVEKGYDIEKSVFWLDDSGLELDENLTNGPEFGNCTYRMNPYKQHGPGAEMKNAINAMQNQPFEGERGTRGLIKRFQAAASRLLQHRIEAGVANPEVSHDALDRCSVVILSVKDMVDAIAGGASFQEILDKVPMHFFQAATEHRLIFEPRPDAKAVDTKNFLVPAKDPDGRTQAENPHYVAQHGIAAQIVKAAARVLGFEKHEKGSNSLSPIFARAAGEEWRLGTQHSIHAGTKGGGLGKNIAKTLTGLYRLMPGNGGRFDLGKPRDHTLKLEDDTKLVMRNALNNFYDFTLRVNGFLLTPDTRKLSGDEHFWHRAFTFFSLIVGRQINDKAVTAKPLVVMDCPTWRPFIGLLETYSGGLIPEMPHEILDDIVKEGDDLVKSLNRAFAEYRPDEVPSYIFREDGQKCPKDLFNVTIYCSASTTDYPMKLWARDFAFDCGALGFGVKNGGGTGPDGLMIETSEGVKIVKEQFDRFLKGQGLPGAARTHISSIQCVDTAQEEGLCKFNDYWAVYPTIYQRMHELQNAEAEVVLPGGAGTMQEIAASVLMRKAGIYGIENRPLVIINHAGIFDPFLAMIPQADLKRYNISIVQSADQAMDILLEARRARGMEPALPYTQDEFKTYKKAFQRAQRQQELGPVLQNHTIN